MLLSLISHPQEIQVSGAFGSQNGDSPLWDPKDPLTCTPWGWEIKDKSKWVDYAQEANIHGLAPTSPGTDSTKSSGEVPKVVVEKDLAHLDGAAPGAATSSRSKPKGANAEAPTRRVKRTKKSS